jgi:hypothetical protein
VIPFCSVGIDCLNLNDGGIFSGNQLGQLQRLIHDSINMQALLRGGENVGTDLATLFEREQFDQVMLSRFRTLY